MHDHLSTTLNHAKDRRLFFLHRTSTGLAFAAAPTAFSLFALHHLRLSLMTGHHIGFIALHLVGEDHCWLFYHATTQLSRHLICITLIDGQLVGNLLIRQQFPASDKT